MGLWPMSTQLAMSSISPTNSYGEWDITISASSVNHTSVHPRTDHSSSQVVCSSSLWPTLLEDSVCYWHGCLWKTSEPNLFSTQSRQTNVPHFSWCNHRVWSVLTADGLTLNYLNHTNSETFLIAFKFSLQTDIHNVKCLQHLSYLDETRQIVAHHSISLGLYRIYFFLIRPEPDFQIDCNFTNLMCKTLRPYKWFEFLFIFCAAVTVTSFTHTHAVNYAAAL